MKVQKTTRASTNSIQLILSLDVLEKMCGKIVFFLIVNYTTLPSDNILGFRRNLSERI